jgi:hypothetical protein
MRRSVTVFVLSVALAFSGYAFAKPQPLTRAACTKAGMSWDENGNVCGGGAAVTPTKEEGKKAGKHDGDKKGKKGGKGGKSTKKVVKKVHGNKVTKKVTTSEGTKKTTEKKGPSKKEQRKFFKWLKGQDKKS